MPSMRKQMQPSIGAARQQQMQQAMREGQIPDDMGLLPETFVMPRGKNRPSWFSNFRGRWRLEKKRLRTRLSELGSLVAYRFIMIRPRPRLRLLTIPNIARDLHHAMYTRFAAGNLARMESQICEGMLTSLRARIAQRSPNTSLKWTLHRYIHRPKLASYRVVVFPEQKGETNKDRNGLIQAVVRIQSLQSLQHLKRVRTRDGRNQLSVKEVAVDAQGREMEPLEEGVVPSNAKESVEYFVVQKVLKKGKEGRWMVWGTTEEMTLEKMAKEERIKKTREGGGAIPDVLPGGFDNTL